MKESPGPREEAARKAVAQAHHTANGVVGRARDALIGLLVVEVAALTDAIRRAAIK